MVIDIESEERILLNFSFGGVLLVYERHGGSVVNHHEPAGIGFLEYIRRNRDVHRDGVAPDIRQLLYARDAGGAANDVYRNVMKPYAEPVFGVENILPALHDGFPPPEHHPPGVHAARPLVPDEDCFHQLEVPSAEGFVEPLVGFEYLVLFRIRRHFSKSIYT